ncbi:MAG: DUF4383 domain-containing protein [Bdellovibrionota bacterium]
MHPKRFALIIGLVLFVVGVLSFIPAFTMNPAEGLPNIKLETSYGLFLGYFAMNILNKIALIGFGLLGIWASSRPTTNLPASINYSRTLFVVMGALAVLGLFTSTQTLGGYMPLWGFEVWSHAVVAVLGAYFGFALSSRVPKQPDVPKRVHV